MLINKEVFELTMIEAKALNSDAMKLLASKFYEVELSSVTARMRQSMKVMVFPFIYGRFADSLVDLDIEAPVIDQYKKVFEKVLEYSNSKSVIPIKRNYSELGRCNKCGATQLMCYYSCNYNGVCDGSVITEKEYVDLNPTIEVGDTVKVLSGEPEPEVVISRIVPEDILDHAKYYFMYDGDESYEIASALRLIRKR